MFDDVIEKQKCPICDSERVQTHREHDVSWCNDCHAIFTKHEHKTEVHALSGNIYNTNRTTMVFNNDDWDWHDYGCKIVVNKKEDD